MSPDKIVRDIGDDPQPGDVIKVWPGQSIVVQERHGDAYVDYSYSDSLHARQGMPLREWRVLFPLGVYKLESDTPVHIVEHQIEKVRKSVAGMMPNDELRFGTERLRKCQDGRWWWNGCYFDSIGAVIEELFDGITDSPNQRRLSL